MKAILFVVLISLICGARLSADERVVLFDCDASYELGRQEARQVSSWGWFWASFGASALLYTGVLMYEFSYSSDEEDGMWLLGIGGPAAFSLSILIPLLATPQPKSLPGGTDFDADCYRQGYIKKLRGKNTTASFLGFAAGSILASGYIYIAAIGLFVISF